MVCTVIGRPFSSDAALGLARLPNRPVLAFRRVLSSMAITVLVPSSAVTCILSPLRAVMTPRISGPFCGAAAVMPAETLAAGGVSWAVTPAVPAMLNNASMIRVEGRVWTYFICCFLIKLRAGLGVARRAEPGGAAGKAKNNRRSHGHFRPALISCR